MIAFIAGHRASRSAASSIAPSTYFKRVAQQRSPTRLSAGAQRDQVPKPEVARVLTCAAEPNMQRELLHAFLIASICTIARPGAAQIDLNPRGHAQNRNTAPCCPSCRCWLVTYFNRGIQDVDRGWKTMLINLTCPKSKR